MQYTREELIVALEGFKLICGLSRVEKEILVQVIDLLRKDGNLE